MDSGLTRKIVPVIAPTSHVADAGAFIAADIGGTHARVGLVRAIAPPGSRVEVLAHVTYACADYPSLAAILADFRDRHGVPGTRQAVVACPGVLLDDVVINTNLPWRVSPSALGRELGLRRVDCINDFMAAAHAAQCMGPGETLLLTPGVSEPPPGPVLVIGPGTGLGAALRIPHAGGTIVLPTEAGQAAFAPGSPREIEILRWLQRDGRYVATERVVSGPGLVNLYAALCALDGAPAALSAPAAIDEAARRGDAHAHEAVLTFCSLLGSVIGDVVVTVGARAVFIAGGVVPRLKDFLPASDFRVRMLDKGSMRAPLERVPVRLIEDAQLGVIGAASWFLQHRAENQPAA